MVSGGSAETATGSGVAFPTAAFVALAGNRNSPSRPSPIRTVEVLVTSPGRNFVTLRVAAYLPFDRLKDGTVHDW